MGCVTSKVMSRTGSFRDDINRSLRMRHGGFPALEELLFSSSTNANGGNQILAICSASSTNKDEHPNPGTIIINTWELMAGLDEQNQLQQEEQNNILFAPKRSQSFHADNGNGTAITGIRSRSFHTVDEYDAIMMERDWEARLEDFLTDIPKVHTPHSSGNMSKTFCDAKVYGNVADEDVKGVQRKSRGKDLSPLAIPSTIDFPALGPVVQYSLVGDYSNYVTPRFGSIGLSLSSNRDERGEEEIKEESVFDPDLVASFDMAMEQFLVEEEFLEQIEIA